LVTGTYILQSKKARYNQYAVDPTCLLCKNGPETSVHFLMECKALQEARSRSLRRIGHIQGGLPTTPVAVITRPRAVTIGTFVLETVHIIDYISV
jgi:hypothetical protein